MRVWLPVVRTRSGTDVFSQRLADGLRAHGVNVVLTWYPHHYEFLPWLMPMRSPRGVDLIHANSWNSHVFLRLGIPVVTTVHHLVHDPAYVPYRTIGQTIYHRMHLRSCELRAIRKSDAVTAVSAYVAKTVACFSGRQDITVIPNWVDTDRYQPHAKYDLARSARPFRLLMVGNHGRRKGEDLLGQFVVLLGDGFDLRCTGGLRGDNVGHSRGITYLGRLDEDALIHEYQHCDAVISLSRYEGFGYTALEGMACGKPFVGFNTSGISEVVVDCHTGFLAPVDDIGKLADLCRKLAARPMLLAMMGKAARHDALERFSGAAALDAYTKLYAKIEYRAA